MRLAKLGRACLLVVLATTALSTAVGQAAASRLLVDDRDFRVTFRSMKLWEWLINDVIVDCEVTLTGSFHASTFPKTNGLQIGVITAMQTRECAEGSFAGLLASPWQIKYVFTFGTLPTITSIAVNVVGMAMEVHPGALTGFHCLFVSTDSRPATGEFYIEARGRVTRFNWAIEPDMDVGDLPDSPWCDTSTYDVGLWEDGTVEDTTSNALSFLLI